MFFDFHDFEMFEDIFSNTLNNVVRKELSKTGGVIDWGSPYGYKLTSNSPDSSDKFEIRFRGVYVPFTKEDVSIRLVNPSESKKTSLIITVGFPSNFKIGNFTGIKELSKFIENSRNKNRDRDVPYVTPFFYIFPIGKYRISPESLEINVGEGVVDIRGIVGGSPKNGGMDDDSYSLYSQNPEKVQRANVPLPSDKEETR